MTTTTTESERPIWVTVSDGLSDEERRMLMVRRSALIMELGAIEDYLGMERTIRPRAERIKAAEMLRRMKVDL
jgi:hypothetical protein